MEEFRKKYFPSDPPDKTLHDYGEVEQPQTEDPSKEFQELPLGTLEPWYEDKDIELRRIYIWDDELAAVGKGKLSRYLTIAGTFFILGMLNHLRKRAFRYARRSFWNWNANKWRSIPLTVPGPRALFSPWAKRYGRHWEFIVKTPSYADHKAYSRLKLRKFWRRRRIRRMWRRGGVRFAMLPLLFVTVQNIIQSMTTFRKRNFLTKMDPVGFMLSGSITSFLYFFGMIRWRQKHDRRNITRRMKMFGYSLIGIGVLSYGLRHANLTYGRRALRTFDRFEDPDIHEGVSLDFPRGDYLE